MIASKIFLKDMITKKKVKNYLVFIFICAFILSQLFEDFIKSAFNENNISWITMIVIFTSTAYSIYTYSLYEKVKNYISLPIKHSGFLLGFIISLFFVSFLERVSLLIIVVCLSGTNILVNISMVIAISILCILINVWMLMLINRKNKLELVLLLIILLCSMFTFYFNMIVFFKFLIIAGCCLVALVNILKKESIYIAIIRPSKTLLTRFKYRGNYFIKILMNEKIYLINTAMLIGVIIFLLVLKMDNYIIWSFTWTVGAVNTPVLTMLSSDLYLRKHAEMISERTDGIWKMYMRFIIIYFVSINILIFALNILFDRDNLIINIIALVILCIIEPSIGYILESKFPLLKWQTKQELWKHPRKYIISITVFFIMTIIGMIAL